MQELWILVISRMAHLIFYEIIMGPAHVFFLPGAHGIIKPGSCHCKLNRRRKIYFFK